MTRRHPVFPLLLVILLGAAAPAPARAQKPDSAEQHFEKAMRHYQAGEHDAAIVEFNRAYALSHESQLLYNLAQVYRKKGDHRQALAHYRRYLDAVPDAPNRAAVEERIAELAQLVGDADTPSLSGAPPPAPVTPAPAPAPVAVAPPAPVAPAPVNAPVAADPPRPVPAAVPGSRFDAPERPGRGRKIVGVAAMGTGIVLGSAAVYFAMEARARADEVTKLSHDRGQWDPTLESEGKADETRAIVFAAVGGTVLVAGGVLYYLGWREARQASRPDLAVAPTAGGASLVVSCGF